MLARTPTAFAVCFLVASLLALQGAESTRILNKIKSAGDFRLRQVGSGSNNVVSAMSTPQTTSYSKTNLALTLDSAVDTGSSQAALGPKDYAVLHPNILKDEVKAIKLSPPPFIPPEPESSGSQSEPPFEPPKVYKPAPQKVATPGLPQTGSSSQTPCADVACIGSKITRIVSSFDAEEKAAEIQAQQLREFQRAIATVPKGFSNELKEAKSSLDRAATLRAATDQFVQGATQRLFNIIRKADKVKCASLNVAKSALKEVVIAMPKAATVLHPIKLESLPPSAPAAPAPSPASSFRFRSVTPSDLVFHVRQDRTPVLASADDAANEEFSAFAAAFPAAAASDADCEN